MSYNAEISRINPGCFLFLVDQSGSMSRALGAQPGSYKHEQAAAAVNRTLSDIIQRCSQGEEVRDYFHVGVITYSTNRTGGHVVTTPFAGVEADDPFRLASEVEAAAEIIDRPVRESDGKGGLIEVIEAIPEWVGTRVAGRHPHVRGPILSRPGAAQVGRRTPRSPSRPS